MDRRERRWPRSPSPAEIRRRGDRLRLRRQLLVAAVLILLLLLAALAGCPYLAGAGEILVLRATGPVARAYPG